MVGRTISAASMTVSTVLNQIGWTPLLRSRTDLRVVLYHGIGNGSSPCMSALDDDVPMASFARQMSYLQSRYRIVSLEQATRAMAERMNGDVPLCCITFDDGLASVYRQAFPFLASRSIPSTVFLNTAVVGNRGLLWQHRLSYLLHHHGVGAVSNALRRHGFEIDRSPRTSRALIDLCKRRFASLAASEAVEKVFAEFGVCTASVARSEELYLDWEQIRDMSANGVMFCSHTANHLPLGAVDDAVMRQEIDEAKIALERHLGVSGRFLSFPFGMECDFGVRARAYALANGYDYVLEVEDGWNPDWRVRRYRSLGRVGLGTFDADETSTYAAVEVEPLFKGILKSMRLHRRDVPGHRKAA